MYETIYVFYVFNHRGVSRHGVPDRRSDLQFQSLVANGVRNAEVKVAIMSKWYVWHNVRMMANQYFVCKGNKVKFGIPRWLGRIAYHFGIVVRSE